MCGFVHVDNKCGHMSISCFGDNVQIWVWVCHWLEDAFLMVPHVLGVSKF